MARQYDAGGQESYLDLAGASARSIAAADARYQAALAAQGIPQSQISAMLASAKASALTAQGVPPSQISALLSAQGIPASEISGAIESATASQVAKDSLASPRDAARALFVGGVQGAAFKIDQTGSQIRKDDIYKVQEETQVPAPLLSSGMIFNYSTTAGLASAPQNYRAFARAFNFDQGGTPILAGQRRLPAATTLSPSSNPPAGLNGTNTQPWTGQAWAGQTKYSYFNATSQFVSPIDATQVGYQPSNLTQNGIGIDIWINFTYTLPKLWNVTLFYYDSPFTGGVLQSTKLCTNNVFQYKRVNDAFGNPIVITNQKPIRSTDRNYAAGYSNLQLYFCCYGAVNPQPTGFEAIPANVLPFDATNRSEWPRLLWTCA
jgi:hypothetical protein